jgi:hypothetical protein
MEEGGTGMPETISPLSSVSDTYSHARLLNDIETTFCPGPPTFIAPGTFERRGF